MWTGLSAPRLYDDNHLDLPELFLRWFLFTLVALACWFAWPFKEGWPFTFTGILRSKLLRAALGGAALAALVIYGWVQIINRVWK